MMIGWAQKGQNMTDTQATCTHTDTLCTHLFTHRKKQSYISVGGSYETVETEWHFIKGTKDVSSLMLKLMDWKERGRKDREG